MARKAANMNDLNNIFYFVKIVEHGSLSAASDALGVAKSMLSRHLSILEQELGVRLIQRTTRKLHVTDIGVRYYEQCRVVLSEMERASSMIDHVRTLPPRKLRISCPLNFAQVVLAPVLTAFMAEYAEVEVALDFTNRDVSSIEEGYDLALHIGPDRRSTNLITRSFTLNQELLVASPALLSRLGIPREPADLKSMPSVAGALPPEPGGRYVWHLAGPAGEQCAVPHFPRLVAEDLWVIKQSAMAGCGVAELPPLLCRDALDDGRLVQLLPGWSLPPLKLHAVYHSRRGLSPAAGTLVDFLSSQLRPWLDTVRDGTLQLHMQPAKKRHHRIDLPH
jgi:DNA-binding transcriptional LysR family regulator